MGKTVTSSTNALDTKAGVALTTPLPPLSQIRHWVADMLCDLADDVVQDVLLICTELVANAYDHARVPRRLRLRRLAERDTLRIEVEDSSQNSLPVLGVSSLGDTRGRGLVMVDKLSCHHWGAYLLPGGKAVWAELRLP